MAKLDISQLTEAASANARGVAGGATKAPAAEPAAKPKSRAKPRAAAAATATPASSRPAAQPRSQAKPAAARSANKRRDGTVRLSLDAPAADVDAFRAYAKARRHSQETVFRAMVQMLLSADRSDYLDIVEALPPE